MWRDAVVGGFRGFRGSLVDYDDDRAFRMPQTIVTTTL